VGRTTCSAFAPDGARSFFASSHLDPEATKHYAEENQLRENERKKAGGAVTSGTSTRIWIFSKPTQMAQA